MAELDRYFEILEIMPGAPLAVIKRAYRTMARKWHPDRFTGLEDKAIAEIKFKQINLAYERLRDACADAAQPPDRDPPRPTAAPPAPASTPVSTQSKSPQLLYQRAADYARAENYEAAIACLSQAIQLQPDYAAAYRYRGHLRSLLSLERSATADLQKADQIERQIPRSPQPAPVPTPPAATTVLSEGRPQLQQLGPVTAMAVRSDAGLLMTGNATGTLRLWRQSPGSLVAEMTAHVGQVTGLCAIRRFGQLGRRMISAGADGRLKCWRIYAGRWGHPRYVCRQILMAHHGAVTAMSAQHNRVMTAGIDGDLKFWQIGWRGLLQCVEQIPAHTGAVTALALNPNAELVVSGGQDGYTYLWCLSMHVCLGSLPHKAGIATAAAFSPQGQLVAIGEDAGWVQILRVKGEPGQISVEAVLPAHAGPVRSLCWLSDNRLVTTGADHAIRVWSPTSEQPQVAIVNLASNSLSFALPRPTTLLYGTEAGMIFQLVL